jgi:predicted lipoprotein
MKKGIKYILLAALIVLTGYNSIYIRKLSDVNNASAATSFDAAAYARHFLHTTLPAHTDKAIDITQLPQALKTNAGNNRFFLVKGQGRITKVDSEYTYLDIQGRPVLLATRYIIGTAPRDASGLISVDDFTTTMEMNTVSEELNRLIRTEVLPPFTTAAKPGENISFIGAIELQQNKTAPDSLEVTPLILNIK